MANHPSILTFGLPESEELLLERCVREDPLLRSQIQCYMALSQLLGGTTLPSAEFRNGVWLVVLDRTYNIEANTYTPHGADPASISAQARLVETWFPNTQIVCATNSPLRFEQEQIRAADLGDRFLGVAPYVKLHRNLHFVDQTQK